MLPSDPRAVHRGDLPEARPLDITTIGKARGLLDNASSATAHGDHKDAIGYVRQALDLLGAEAVRVGAVGSVSVTRQATTADLMNSRAEYASAPGPLGCVRVAPERDPLVAARERLGVWLAAEPGRAWDYEDRPFGTDCHVVTLTSSEEQRDIRRHDAREVGADLASAILAALEKASS